MHRIERCLRGLEPSNHLDQLHHRHRIEKMHPDHLFRTLRYAGNLRNRDRARIRRKNRLRSQYPVQVPKQRRLDLKPLRRSFNRNRSGSQILQLRRQRNPRPSLIRLFLGQLLLRHLARNVRANRVQPAVKCLLIDVIQHHVEARPGTHMRDAVPHGPGTQNRNRFRISHKAV
jgi:hypothetical protein